MHTLEMRTHQPLPDCHQTVCRSTNCVCCFIQLAITITSVPVNIVFIVFIVIIFILIDLLIRVIPGNCIFDARRGTDTSKLSTAATTASYFLALESLAASAASHHCVLKASTKAQTSSCCQCFHPQRLSCHSWSTRMQTHSKSDQTFQPAKYFECFRAENPLISAFEAFSAWPTFDYCKVNRRVQCLVLSP